MPIGTYLSSYRYFWYFVARFTNFDAKKLDELYQEALLEKDKGDAGEQRRT